MKRREMLTALLGAPRRSPRAGGRLPLPAFEGRLLGQNAAVGHRVRDGFRPEPERFEEVGVVVVGAGVAGLSAAWKLARSGLPGFVVLELEDHPGGTARWGRTRSAPSPGARTTCPCPRARSGPSSSCFREMRRRRGRGRGRPPHRRRGAPLPRAAGAALPRRPLVRGPLPPRRRRPATTCAQLDALRGGDGALGRLRAMRGAAAPSPSPASAARTTPELDALDRISMAELAGAAGLDSPRLRWCAGLRLPRRLRRDARDDLGLGRALLLRRAGRGARRRAARSSSPGPRATGALVRAPRGRRGPAAPHGGRWSPTCAPADGAASRCAPSTWRASAAVGVARRPRRSSRCRAPRARAWSRPTARRRPPHLADFAYGSWMVANLHARATARGSRASRSPGTTCSTTRERSATSSRRTRPAATAARRCSPTTCRSSTARPRGARRGCSRRRWERLGRRGARRPRARPPGSRALVDALDVWRWGHAMVRPTRRALLRGGALRAARAPLGRIHFAHTDLSGHGALRGGAALGRARGGGDPRGARRAVPELARDERAARWLFSPPHRPLRSSAARALAAFADRRVGLAARRGLDGDTPPGLWLAAVLVRRRRARVGDRLPRLRRSRRAAPAAAALPRRARSLALGRSASLLYLGRRALFWRVLAYVAVFHFVRQQYGWVMLYRRARGRARSRRAASSTARRSTRPRSTRSSTGTRTCRGASTGSCPATSCAGCRRVAARRRRGRTRRSRSPTSSGRSSGPARPRQLGQAPRRRDDGALLVRRHRRVRLGLRVHGHERARPRRALLRAGLPVGPAQVRRRAGRRRGRVPRGGCPRSTRCSWSSRSPRSGAGTASSGTSGPASSGARGRPRAGRARAARAAARPAPGDALRARRVRLARRAQEPRALRAARLLLSTAAMTRRPRERPGTLRP